MLAWAGAGPAAIGANAWLVEAGCVLAAGGVAMDATPGVNVAGATGVSELDAGGAVGSDCAVGGTTGAAGVAGAGTGGSVDTGLLLGSCTVGDTRTCGVPPLSSAVADGPVVVGITTAVAVGCTLLLVDAVGGLVTIGVVAAVGAAVCVVALVVAVGCAVGSAVADTVALAAISRPLVVS